MLQMKEEIDLLKENEEKYKKKIYKLKKLNQSQSQKKESNLNLELEEQIKSNKDLQYLLIHKD